MVSSKQQSPFAAHCVGVIPGWPQSIRSSGFTRSVLHAKKNNNKKQTVNPIYTRSYQSSHTRHYPWEVTSRGLNKSGVTRLFQIMWEWRIYAIMVIQTITVYPKVTQPKLNNETCQHRDQLRFKLKWYRNEVFIIYR